MSIGTGVASATPTRATVRDFFAGASIVLLTFTGPAWTWPVGLAMGVGLETLRVGTPTLIASMRGTPTP